MAETKTERKLIREIQVRVRTQSGGTATTLPGEDEQFLVFLEGETGYYFVPIKNATDGSMELEMMATLREAFFNGKAVELGYRTVGSDKYITAVWIAR